MGENVRELLQRKSALVGLGLVLLIALPAVLSPLIAPHDPTDGQLRLRLKPGFWSADGASLLGTDDQGRDILSRVLFGARTSLLVAAVAVGIAAFFGLLVGVLAGYYGGWVDTLLMRGCDVLLAIPAVLLAIVILSVLGSGLDKAMVAIGVVYSPQLARIARGSTMKTRSLDFVEAQRALGAGSARIILRHILPNILAPVIVFLTMSFASAILDSAALGFLGLGAQPPNPELGAMLASAQKTFLRGAWWAATFPGLAILLTVLGLNLLGDGLRDALDPRLRP